MRISRQAKRQAKQLFGLCLADGLLDEVRARGVVACLAASQHRDSQAILVHFAHLLRLDRAQHTATIESAVPLPEDLRADFQAGLARRYGPGLTTEFVEDSALIGGVRVQVGYDVYDGSVRAGLAALAKDF